MPRDIPERPLSRPGRLPSDIDGDTEQFINCPECGESVRAGINCASCGAMLYRHRFAGDSEK